MKRKLRLPLLMLLVACVSSASFGQKILHKANKQFRLKHYHEAIDSYTKTLDSYPDNLEAKSKIAECYRMTNQLTKAADAYATIMPEQFVDPIYIRNYGITLMKMAKYNDAHYQFELYKIYNPQDAQHYQLSCEFAHHLYKREQKYEVEHVGVNTANSDFGVAYLGDKLIFSSFRNDVSQADMDAKKGMDLSGNMLYTATLEDDLRAKDVKFLRSGIAEKKNIGPISFAENANICAFTRNKIENGGAHVTGDDSSHSIYIAELKENGDWYNERPFRYNEFGTSTGFPSLAFDGSALYFSSNRVGGFGGYDIYVSYHKDDTWTYPVNLGEEINTPGNEITPFFTGTDLYFSSDYHHGMGGYDIFHSEVDGGVWNHPINMANGINSPADDYYPSIKQGKEGIFFSSNRLGGRGMDDIYLAMPIVEQELAMIIPDAVELTEMESTIILNESSNSLAKAVSSKETTEIIVLNPENGTPDTKEEETNYEEEELPMWGFADVPEKKEIEKKEDVQSEVANDMTEPRALLTFSTVDAHEVTDVSSTYDKTIKTPNITIYSERANMKWDAYASELETELDTKAETKAETETETEVETEVATKTEVAADSDVVISQPEIIEEIVSEAAEPVIATEMTESPTEEIASVQIAEKPASYKIPDYKAISAKKAPLNLDLGDARRVSLGELLPASDVYFIQLAALSKSSGNVNQFKRLSKYGNLYKVFKTASTKIKLGYFLDKSEASSILKSVKAQGFSDAFITRDDLSQVQLELIVANEQQAASYQSYADKSAISNKPMTSGNSTYNSHEEDFSLNNPGRKTYKIRLASYEDPIWFDIEKAKTLGKIEQWTKGSWTIFILGGYATYKEAEQARIMCVNKGFGDAEIVIDNNGILERLKVN